MSRTTDVGTRRSSARPRRRLTRAFAGAAAVGMLVASYVALDIADVAPGPLTAEPPIEVQALPQPATVAITDAEAATALPDDAPVPTDLAGIVEPVLEDADLTGRWSYDIRDAVTGEVLLARDESTAHTPASVTKVLTGAAALGSLGAGEQFTTRTALSDDGSSGTPVVHVIGGGDVLLGPGESDPESVMGRAGLQTLAEDTAAALQEAGITQVVIAADLSRYDGDGWHSAWERADISNGYITPIVPLMQESGYSEPGQRFSSRHADAAEVAVDTFASALTAADSALSVTVEDPAQAPDGARELASVDSAPVSELVEFMLVRSDNVVAEVLGREVALADGHSPTAAEAPSAVIDSLASQGLETGSITLADTSGLDYANRISAHDLTTIVAESAQADGDLSLLIPSMPVAGFSGTLAPRFGDDGSRAGAGVVVAKTGALATVSSLAGTVLTADERLLVFSMMADEMDRGTSNEARQAFDTALAQVAQCGCS